MKKRAANLFTMVFRSRAFRFVLGFVTGILIWSLFSTSWARADELHKGFSLQLDPSGITPAEKAPVESFLTAVEQLVPHAMKDEIGHPIRVRFANLSGNMTRLEVPACEGIPSSVADQVPASAKTELLGQDRYGGRSRVLFVNALFKQEILAGPNGTRTYPCGHYTMYRLAEATVIHELTHIFDSRLGRRKSTRNSYFQKLMGFTDQRSWETLFLIPFLKPKNRLYLRSPDPYEFASIREAFAVNMEYFVLDPEYGCRRPAVDAYYRELLGIKSAPRCKLDTAVFLNSDNPDLNLKTSTNLDPSRIYDIHYLLASSGSGLDSRWGHAMYRIIVCAPWRTKVGPDCLQDVQYHVVLSYRADVSDLVLSYMKGLDGGYPSQLYLFSLADILNEYNKLQLRDLISLPLRLTGEQKREFIYRTLEQYWEYQGRYYFLTNNCASESLTLLQGVVSDRKIQKLHDMTPTGLESDLSNLGLINESLATDQATAIREGYFFPSKKPVLDRAFLAIQSEIGNMLQSSRIQTTDDYLSSTTADERQQLFKAAIQAAKPFERIRTAAYFYLLESAISSFDQQRIDEQAAADIENSSDSSNGATTTRALEPTIRPTLLLALEGEEPWEQLSSGYGVPQPEDFSAKIAESQDSAIVQAYRELQSWVETRFQSDIAEFKKIQLNLSAFAEVIAK